MGLHAIARRQANPGTVRIVYDTDRCSMFIHNKRFRQDAVQDLIDHPTFEADFTRLAKGLPDLERIISRIHAKNCKVKDFLKVLEVFLIVAANSASLNVNITS